jgi:hypothetical protein
MTGKALFYLFMLTAAANLAAIVGAQYWAFYLKQVRKAPPDLPNFLFVPDLTGLPTLHRLYSDLHRRYGSRFISRCIAVARVTTPATLLLLMANIAGLFLTGR